MKRLRVLSLVPKGSIPPETLEGMSYREIAPVKMEYDVTTTLDNLGHEVKTLDVRDDLGPIREAVDAWKPHVVFNMLEEFHGFVAFDQNVVAYLELMQVPYTGCNPRGLVLARDKALTKKILSYHRIKVPGFAVFPHPGKLRVPRRLRFPLVVKSLIEEASSGISQASIVHDGDQLRKRVAFMHEQFPGGVIAEEYVEGREVYVGVLGNRSLRAFPLWELILPEGAPRIATAKVKFDTAYQKKHGITSQRAEGIAAPVEAGIARLVKRIYRLLGLSGYARLDMRLTPEGDVYVLEANPNPDLAVDEDFALAAEAGGMGHRELVAHILSLGLRYYDRWYA
jgi:D-alanine-D-alanine ligase